MARGATWPWLAGALLAVTLVGCATEARTPFAVRTSRDARVEWRHGGRTFATTAVFQTGEDSALRLVVGGSRPELTLTREIGEWTAVGPIAGRPWRGSTSAVPSRVEGWLNVLEAYEGAAYGSGGDRDVRNGRFSVRYIQNGPALGSLELVAVATGDRFRVWFANYSGATEAVRASRTSPR